jgi:amidase
MDATDILAARRAGTLSATDHMAATLDHIATVNPGVNAVVSLRPRDECLDDANAADAAGVSTPLMGLPMAIKDLADTKGLRTTYGSPIFADHIPTKDSQIVARLRAAGAIIIGKTNTPEFGLGSHSYNPVHGTALNPHDTSRSAGGSSGGAAVALASRMLDLADGSDMMGSLRNPAGWNNVYGFRPSFGLVPGDAEGDNFLHQLSTSGPMARSVRDLALLLSVMAGPDPRQPHSALHPPFQGIQMPPTGSTIGWIADWGGHYPMEPGVLALCERALGVFSDLGYRVKILTPSISPDALWESWTVLRSWAIASGDAALFENTATRAQLKPELAWEIERGLAMSGADVQAASVIRRAWFAEFSAMQDVDFLALPSAQMFAFDATLDWPKSIAGQALDTYHRWMEVVIPASLIGVPALSVPTGFVDGGTPMGLQLIAKRGADALVLGAGQQYHLATGWPDLMVPPNAMRG